MPMRIPVPEGPKPTWLVGNLPELIGGVHIGFPNLIQRYGDPGIFTFCMPNNMSPGVMIPPNAVMVGGRCCLEMQKLAETIAGLASLGRKNLLGLSM